MSAAKWTPAAEVDPLSIRGPGQPLCGARRSAPNGKRDEYGYPDRDYFICTAPAGHWKPTPEAQP